MSQRPSLHLVCNAHLDPVWLWEWPEGAGEALSTFRIAADFCEQSDGFIFNHNEALLYRWVEEYDPVLFARIQQLVREGRWHIMGGWWLQPDCNMPAGESLVRQILHGKRYFREKFGVDVRTAINFDPFGHSRGLVQIMAKSGYDAYIFCRPGEDTLSLPAMDFTWIGFDGSTVTASRPWGAYESRPGKARAKVEEWLHRFPDVPCGLLLWGIGNHGGGPSREDLDALQALITAHPERDIHHSTPEAFFAEVRQRTLDLPKYAGDLNPTLVGCYTSQSRIKRKHRQLENALYLTEKMATAAWLHNLLPYPAEELTEATHDLLFCQFHDALPGTSIKPVEDQLLDTLGHGLEILNRVRTRVFFAMAAGEPPAQLGTIPILVYNPHPYPLRQLIECELSLPDYFTEPRFTPVNVYKNDRQIPSQVEQHLSNHQIDWRKHMVFLAELAPASITRFDCRLGEPLPAKPVPMLAEQNGQIVFKTADLEVIINTQTGLLDRYRVHEVDYLATGACCPIVMEDTADPWAMSTLSFRTETGRFSLMTPEAGSAFSGLQDTILPSVRVIEDGEVRSVVEAVFAYNHSFICQSYLLPRTGTAVEIETRVYWQEKDRMLKLSLPFCTQSESILGQTAYGTQALRYDGSEVTAQQWITVRLSGNTALTVINDGTYACDCDEHELRLSLLRSPAYTGMPINNPKIVPQDRFTPRIDQGEHLFRFRINAGLAYELMTSIDREAQAFNESPYALSCFPAGTGTPSLPAITFSDPAVRLAAMKKAEDSNDLILRLFEPTGQPRKADITLPGLQVTLPVSLIPFEVKSLQINPKTGAVSEVNLLEEKMVESRDIQNLCSGV